MDSTDIDLPRCQATTTAGAACRGRPLPGKAFCLAHDDSPDMVERRRAGNVAGGHNRSTAARVSRLLPVTLRPVAGRLLEAIAQVHDGELDPRVLSAMAAGAGALTRVMAAGMLEERIAALERGAPLQIEDYDYD